LGYVFHVLLALAIVALAEAAAPPAALPAWAALALLPVPHGLAWAARRAGTGGRFRAAAALARLFEFAPLLLHGAVCFFFGWVAFAMGATGGAEGVAGASEWPGPGLAVALLPYPLFELAAIDARARATGGSRAFNARMLASAFAPLALFALALWPAAAFPAWRAHVDEVALFAFAQVGLTLAVLGLLLPFALRFTWDTQPFPSGPLRGYLETLAAKARFRCRDLLVWRTDGQVANAAILGFSRRTRYVLFTDALIGRLAPRELGAVFAHEIGHATRRHVPIFATFTVGLFVAVDLLVSHIDPAAFAKAFDVLGLSATDGLSLVVALVALVVWYSAFGWLSRRFELDADLVALELTRDPEALASALENVSGLHTRTRRSWRHFSVSERVLFVRAAARDVKVGERLRASLRRMTRWIVACAAVAVLLEVVVLFQAAPLERARAELRLGWFEAALVRAESQGLGAGPEARLARAGLGVGEGASPAQFLAAGWAELAAGRPEGASICLELARMRGAKVPAAGALEEALATAPAPDTPRAAR